MKLSFSTRRWAVQNWSAVLEQAAEMHLDGIEVYDAQCPFRQKDYHELRQRDLTVALADTDLDISLPWSRQELEQAISRATTIHSPYVGCYASAPLWGTIRENLQVLVDAGRAGRVTTLVKTRDALADTSLLRDLLNDFACDELAAAWDVHATVRSHEEQPATTIKNLGAYVRHVLLHDSDDHGHSVLMGEGTAPIQEVMDALRSIDYAGFVSLEWDPEWLPELTDMDIILPHFVNYMERFVRDRTAEARLYPNHDGTGYYIWKHDELIHLTFPQVLDRLADTFPDQYCFRYTTLDYTRTYTEFRTDVEDLARALVAMGVRPGSKVAVWATNVPAWFITFWATVEIGAVLVSVNTAYKQHEVEYLLRQSDTHTLVLTEGNLDAHYADIICELCPEIQHSTAGEPLHLKRLPMLRNVITVGFRREGCLTFEEALQRKTLVSREQVRAMAARVKPDSVC